MSISRPSLEHFGSENDSVFSPKRSLLEEDGIYSKPTALRPSWKHWMFHTINITMWFYLAVTTAPRSPRSCLEKFNAYSPILEAIDDDAFQEVKFKYSLWYNSPFKGPPTPEVQEAWHDIMKYGEIGVPASDILRVGHNLTAVQYPASVGGGYPAIASGTHALHCLHYIWQDHYIDILPSVAETKAQIPEMYERHYEHCIDYTRQYLMCNFDTTIIPLYWVRNHQQPTPNGNTIHKCVDWDRLQNWLAERAVQMPEGFEWRQPEDAVSLDDNP
ncbi:17df0216-ab5f-4fdf-9299-d5be12ebca94 [Sclerotinia trifoliorum]|uniref:17df0216-ab5f-4fdf-9299-d5be12ebca94 n=1 Tax=Sclerotinia trifoliorum TaxID=28548 RepID=A0A8H2VQ58_9HELO|nr:17df0216-ab5f-4fdf-9299-d5be12ebca94 [Sclerotinia trifoliorum]